MSEGVVRTIPWSRTDARTACLAIAVGVGLLAWGWWEASGTGKLDDQTTALVFAVLAAAAVLAGARTWLAAGRRAVSTRTGEVADLLERCGLLGAADAAADDTTELTFVGLPGSSRYHRRGCLLVRGKSVQLLAGGEGAPARRTPCEMCQP